MSHPQSYEILLVPGHVEDTTEAAGSSGAIRSAVVAATGETGASGYPRYSGEGIVADIDPATHAVEALLVDGAELDYGLSVRIKEKNADGDAGSSADTDADSSADRSAGD
ncbi:hypothetical protein OG936_33225 [Streptomyces sp. NBC_00846]|uniref:hypothetical protein n=1 Tax=Streptomyces sp. NBC_00846 TaxID=2975849 RepID=UPI0038661E8C|nr:hypothetical protein OG936_33225 [Streptomyces sp. NBC_00846]